MGISIFLRPLVMLGKMIEMINSAQKSVVMKQLFFSDKAVLLGIRSDNFYARILEGEIINSLSY